MQIKVLCIGDIVGRPGRQMLADHLVHLVKDHNIDCVIANAENSAGGSGITLPIYEKLLKYGVNLITMGDHIYRKSDIIGIMNNSNRIVKPVNLSSEAVGKEWAAYTTTQGPRVAVISILGRVHMPIPTDNPFHAMDRVLKQIPPDIKIIIVDIHAEVTSEKIAMGWYLDSRVSVVFGTHTHVTTADETLLPKGTAYITDLGMTGPHDSILGRSTPNVLNSLTTQMPCPFNVATGDPRLNAIIATLDPNSGKAIHIKRISITGTHINQNSSNPTDKTTDLYSKTTP